MSRDARNSSSVCRLTNILSVNYFPGEIVDPAHFRLEDSESRRVLERFHLVSAGSVRIAGAKVVTVSNHLIRVLPSDMYS